MSASFRRHARPSFKRSHSDLSRSSTPIPLDADGDELREQLPDFLRQTEAEILAKFTALVRTDRLRLESFLGAAPDSLPSTTATTPDAEQPPQLAPPSTRWAIDVSRAARDRNRYRDVQPWSASRVRLRVPAGDVDYINASPVTLARASGGGSGGGGAQLHYIAAQGPKPNGVDHFWQMVWHECGQTAVVVMLTQLVEGMQEKCFQYFPADRDPPPARLSGSATSSRAGTPPVPATAGGAAPAAASPLSPTAAGRAQGFGGGRLAALQKQAAAEPSTATMPGLALALTAEDGAARPGALTLIDTSFDEAAQTTVRKLSLTCGDEARVVYHLLFSGWPDFGVPQGANRAAMLALIRLSREKNEEQEGRPGPRVVHCSAGVGRTGTFIALEHLLAELDSGAWDHWAGDAVKRYEEMHAYQDHEEDSEEEDVEDFGAWPDPVFDTVSRLREQRRQMVQAPTQYGFIYEILAEEWIKRRRMLIEEKKQLAGPGPKAIRIGQGLKKMLHFGRDRARDREREREREKDRAQETAKPVESEGTPTDEDSTDGAVEQSQG